MREPTGIIAPYGLTSPDGPTVIDLFAGVGGLSLGFEMAGARVVAAVEADYQHAVAYEAAHTSGVSVLCGPIQEFSGREVVRSTNQTFRDVDFVIGGPPCQPFSMAGKRNGQADHRGDLVRHFARIVSEIKPRVFLMENVLGLKSIHSGSLFGDLISTFESASYRCVTYILDAADFGVPQRRKRLFIVGTRLTSLSIDAPSPTHRDPRRASLLTYGLKEYVTVREAIWDLRGSRYQTMSKHVDTDVVAYQDGFPNDYQRSMRQGETGVSGNGVTVHFPHIIENIGLAVLPEGAVEPSTRYRRLYWDRPSFTLRAGSGSFTALRPIHPSQPRVITVREAARLQSFPDRVAFSSVKKHAYQQIGNSVPPLLGRAIAKRLISSLVH